jgi:protein-tyrosine phosphatase
MVTRKGREIGGSAADRASVTTVCKWGIAVGSKDRISVASLVDANSGMLSLRDDGSINWSRTLGLAQRESDDGVRQAVVTTPRRSMNHLLSRMPQLKGLLNQHRIPLVVTAAVELTLRSDLFDQVVRISTVVGGLHRRYVLLRVATDTALQILPVVESLRRMNLTTIVIAPERCNRFRSDPSRLQRIVSAGGLVQLSAASLTDQTDRQRIKLCRQLVRQGLCHFVATESGKHHDLPISLAEAYRTIVKWSGLDVADSICCHNPCQMAAGKPIDPLPKRRSMLSIFSRAA